MEEGEIVDDAEVAKDVGDTAEEEPAEVNESDRKPTGWSRRDGNQRPLKKVLLHSNFEFY